MCKVSNFTIHVFFLRKLVEDILHQNKGVRPEKEAREPRQPVCHRRGTKRQVTGGHPV